MSSVITVVEEFFGLLLAGGESEVGPGVGDHVVTLVAQFAATGGGDIERSDEHTLDFWADQVHLSSDEVGGGTSILAPDVVT